MATYRWRHGFPAGKGGATGFRLDKVAPPENGIKVAPRVPHRYRWRCIQMCEQDGATCGSGVRVGVRIPSLNTCSVRACKGMIVLRFCLAKAYFL